MSPSPATHRRMSNEIDRVSERCDHRIVGAPTISTSTPGFWETHTGLAVITCDKCRPVIHRLIDDVYGSHEDREVGTPERTEAVSRDEVIERFGQAEDGTCRVTAQDAAPPQGYDVLVHRRDGGYVSVEVQFRSSASDDGCKRAARVALDDSLGV